MSVRASGTIGPPRVRITYRPSMVARLAAQMGIGGPWHWSIPAPKGHPQPPALLSLGGSAETLALAADRGRARLLEVYQP